VLLYQVVKAFARTQYSWKEWVVLSQGICCGALNCWTHLHVQCKGFAYTFTVWALLLCIGSYRANDARWKSTEIPNHPASSSHFIYEWRNATNAAYADDSSTPIRCQLHSPLYSRWCHWPTSVESLKSILQQRVLLLQSRQVAAQQLQPPAPPLQLQDVQEPISLQQHSAMRAVLAAAAAGP
jgi:hypothetical protein